MAELNLALKKEVFEALQNKESNEIPIKKNDWWKKRLMDTDTGRFKWFDEVIASCGSSDKYRYEIDHIEDQGDQYVIFVVLDKPVEDEPQNEDQGDSDSDVEYIDGEVNVEIKGDIIEPETVEPETVEPEVIEPEVVNKEEPVQEPEDEKKDIKLAILKVFDKFCKMPDVYVVNLPHVVIRNSGMIVGCNRRLLADRDSDVRIDFKRIEITQTLGVSDEEYLNEIVNYLEELLKNSYVFVNKKYSGFATSDFGELIFKLAVVPKKKYLFIRK